MMRDKFSMDLLFCQAEEGFSLDELVIMLEMRQNGFEAKTFEIASLNRNFEKFELSNVGRQL